MEVLTFGDLSSRTEKMRNNNIIRTFGEDIVNDTRDRLIDLCEQQQQKLRIVC